MSALSSIGRSSPLRVHKQTEFIADLCALALAGTKADMQDAALVFKRAYPKISTTFAHRIILELERVGAPTDRFEDSVLAILARCHLACGQTEKACDYLSAARRIIADDALPELRCLIGELEISARLARSELKEAQNAYERLEVCAKKLYGGPISEQLLLGVRLSLATGDLPQARELATQAVECATADEQRCRAQLAVLSVDEHSDGDIRRALIQLSSFEHSLRMRSHPALSPETKAQLFYQLAYAFIQQGKLAQAQARLKKADLRCIDDLHPVELLSAALFVAEGRLDEARHQLRLLESRFGADLCQTEYLDIYVRALALSQATDGARQGLDKAEECYRLCEMLNHEPLRQRVCLLYASALIAAGDVERATCLLQESGAKESPHKMLRFLYGCLYALCVAGRSTTAVGAPEVSLTYLAKYFADEDLSFILLLLLRAHPRMSELLAAQGLDRALSTALRGLCGTDLFSSPQEMEDMLARLPAVQPSIFASETGEQEFSVANPEEEAYSQLAVLQVHPAPRLHMLETAAFTDPGRSLRIQLFGGLQVSRNGSCLNINRTRRNKVRGLLTVLALARGREIARDFIVDTLWPHQERQHSINSFYVVWNALKMAFLSDEPQLPARYSSPERFPFSNTSGRCALLIDYCSLDIEDFDHLIQRVKQAARLGQLNRCLDLSHEILALYEGDVLPADLYTEQLDHVRLHYKQAFIEVMLLAARISLTSHQPALALPFVERGLAVDPSCEELYRFAMHAYALVGRRDDSLRAYYHCRKNLARELGIEPSAELNDLFTRLMSPSSPPQPQVVERLRFAVGE